MSNDDTVRRLKQREQDAKDQRIAEQATTIRELRVSCSQLLMALRRDLPTLLTRAESALVLLVTEERREVGRFRKSWVMEERNWAGWPLTSWTYSSDPQRHAALYLLSDGTLLVYDGGEPLKQGRGGFGFVVSDDFLMDLFLPDLFFRELHTYLSGKTLGTLREQVVKLYRTTELPVPDVPQVPPRDNSVDRDRDREELDMALRSLGIRPATDQIGERQFQLQRFGIPQHVYPKQGA